MDVGSGSSVKREPNGKQGQFVTLLTGEGKKVDERHQELMKQAADSEAAKLVAAKLQAAEVAKLTVSLDALVASQAQAAKLALEQSAAQSAQSNAVMMMLLAKF